MNTPFTLTITTPQSTLTEVQAIYADVPGEAGRFGVLAGHMPLVSTLQAGGTLHAELADGTSKAFTISAGFAEVGPTSVNILAESASEA
jgi:F-type H+-transporting ATPase subunit epsilon